MDLHIRVNSGVVVGLGLGLVVGVGVGAWLAPLKGLRAKWFGDSRGNRAKKPLQMVRKKEIEDEDEGEDEDEDEDDGQERAAERNAFWFREGLTEAFRVEICLKNILFDERSPFQRVQVIETEQFGRTLVMDGQTQSAKADEHIYHESLVHPAMLLHPEPRTAFIGGGGEFATAREVLRHKSVQRCVMVDIDKVACDICREQLPEWNDGAFEDPRLHVEYEDAMKWLEETDEMFDILILDIADPIDAGPGYKMYTTNFYEYAQTKLNDGGILVTQSGPCAVYNAQADCFTVIHRTLRAAFEVVIPYSVDVPSFGCNWGFNLAFQASNSDEARNFIMSMPIRSFDKVIEERILGGAAKLRFLDGVSWHGAIGLPKEIRQQCAEEDRIMTIEKPVFMFSGG